MREPFIVVYRTGGTANCKWRSTISYPTRDAAVDSAKGAERMGYKALVKPLREVREHGLPEGWDA